MIINNKMVHSHSHIRDKGDKHFDKNIGIISAVIIIILIVVLTLLWKFAGLFTKKQENKHKSLNEGYGYYSDPVYLECVSKTGKCNGFASRKVIKHCIPHPITHKGCIDNNGNMTYNTLQTTAQCTKPCIGSAFLAEVKTQGSIQLGTSHYIASGTGCNHVIDPYTGIEYTNYFLDDYDKINDNYPLKKCISEDFVGYSVNRYTCKKQQDIKGDNRCQVTCGFDNTLNLNGVFGNKLSKNVLKYFPTEFDEDGVLRNVCYDINDFNQVEILNTFTNVPNTFNFPSQCYEHYNSKTNINFNEYYPLGTKSTSKNLNFIYDENTNYFLVEGVSQSDLSNIIETDRNINIFQNYETYIKANINNEIVLVEGICFPTRDMVRVGSNVQNYLFNVWAPAYPLGGDTWTDFSYNVGNNNTLATVEMINKGSSFTAITGLNFDIKTEHTVSKFFYTKSKYNDSSPNEPNPPPIDAYWDGTYYSVVQSDGLTEYRIRIPFEEYNSGTGEYISNSHRADNDLYQNLGTLSSDTPTLGHLYYLTSEDMQNGSGYLTPFTIGTLSNFPGIKDPAGNNIHLSIDLKLKGDVLEKNKSTPVKVWFFRTLNTSNEKLTSNYFDKIRFTGALWPRREPINSDVVSVSKPADTLQHYVGISGFYYGTLDVNDTRGYYYPIKPHAQGESKGNIKFKELGDNITFDYMDNTLQIYNTIGPASKNLINYNNIYGSLKIKISYGICTGAAYGFDVIEPGIDYGVNPLSAELTNGFTSDEVPLRGIDPVYVDPKSIDSFLLNTIRNNISKIPLNKDNNINTKQNKKINLYYQMLENSTLSYNNNNNFKIITYPEKSLILKADYDIFRSPYVVKSDGSLDTICYNEHNIPFGKGTVISLELGDVVETNTICTDYNSDIGSSCGVWKTTDNHFCIQERDSTRSLFDDTCLPSNLDNRYFADEGFLENGLDSTKAENRNNLICYDRKGNILKDEKKCSKLLFTKEYTLNDVNKVYPADQELYIKTEKKDYYFSTADKNANDPLNPLFWNRMFNYQEGAQVKIGEKFFIKPSEENQLYVYECIDDGIAPYNLINSTCEFNYEKKDTFYTKFSDLGIHLTNNTSNKPWLTHEHNPNIQNGHDITNFTKWYSFDRKSQSPGDYNKDNFVPRYTDINDYRILFNHGTDIKDGGTQDKYMNYANLGIGDYYIDNYAYKWASNNNLNDIYAAHAASNFPYPENKGFLSQPYGISIKADYTESISSLSLTFSLPESLKLNKGDVYNPSFGFWNTTLQSIATGGPLYQNYTNSEEKSDIFGSHFSEMFFRFASVADLGTSQTVSIISKNDATNYKLSERVAVGDYLFYIPVFGGLDIDPGIPPIWTPGPNEADVCLPIPTKVDSGGKVLPDGSIFTATDRIRTSLRIMNTGQWYGVTPEDTIGTELNQEKYIEKYEGVVPFHQYDFSGYEAMYNQKPADAHGLYLLTSPASLTDFDTKFSTKQHCEFEIVRVTKIEVIENVFHLSSGNVTERHITYERNINKALIENLYDGTDLISDFPTIYSNLFNKKDYPPPFAPSSGNPAGGSDPHYSRTFGLKNKTYPRNTQLNNFFFHFPSKFLSTNFEITSIVDNKATFTVTSDDIVSSKFTYSTDGINFNVPMNTNTIAAYNNTVNYTPYYQQPFIERIFHNTLDFPVATQGNGIFHVYDPTEKAQVFNTITDILFSGVTSQGSLNDSFSDFGPETSLDFFFFNEYKVNKDDPLAFGRGDKISITFGDSVYDFSIVGLNSLVYYNPKLVSEYKKRFTTMGRNSLDFVYNKTYDYKCSHQLTSSEVKQFKNDFMKKYGTQRSDTNSEHIKYVVMQNQISDEDTEFFKGLTTTSYQIFQPKYIFIDESNDYTDFEHGLKDGYGKDIRLWEDTSYTTYAPFTRLLLWLFVVDLTDVDELDHITVSPIKRFVPNKIDLGKLEIDGFYWKFDSIALEYDFSGDTSLLEQNIVINVTTGIPPYVGQPGIYRTTYERKPAVTNPGKAGDYSKVGGAYGSYDNWRLQQGFYTGKKIKYAGIEPYSSFPKLTVDFYRDKEGKSLFNWKPGSLTSKDSSGNPLYITTEPSPCDQCPAGFSNPDNPLYGNPDHNPNANPRIEGYRGNNLVNSLYNAFIPLWTPDQGATGSIPEENDKGRSYRIDPSQVKDYSGANITIATTNRPRYNNPNDIPSGQMTGSYALANYLPTGYQYDKDFSGDIDNLFYNQYELDKGSWAVFNLKETTFTKNNSAEQVRVIFNSVRGKPAGPSIIKSKTTSGGFDKAGLGQVLKFEITELKNKLTEGIYRSQGGFALKTLLDKKIAKFNFLFSVENFNGFDQFTILPEGYKELDVIEYTNINNRRYYRNTENSSKFNPKLWSEIPKTIYPENKNLIEYKSDYIYNKGDITLFQDQLYEANQMTYGMCIASSDFSTIEETPELGSVLKNQFYTIYNEEIAPTTDELSEYRLTNSDNLPLAYQGSNGQIVCPFVCNNTKLSTYDGSSFVSYIYDGIDFDIFNNTYILSYDGISSNFLSLAYTPIPTYSSKTKVDFLQYTQTNSNMPLYSQYVYNIATPEKIVNSQYSCEGACFSGIDNKVMSNALLNMIIPVDIEGQDLPKYVVDGICAVSTWPGPPSATYRQTILTGKNKLRIPQHSIQNPSSGDPHYYVIETIRKRGNSYTNQDLNVYVDTESNVSNTNMWGTSQSFIYNEGDPGLIVEMSSTKGIKNMKLTLEDSDLAYLPLPLPNDDLYYQVSGEYKEGYRAIQNPGTCYLLGEIWYGLDDNEKINCHGYLNPTALSGALTYDSFIVSQYPITSERTKNIVINSDKGSGAVLNLNPYSQHNSSIPGLPSNKISYNLFPNYKYIINLPGVSSFDFSLSDFNDTPEWKCFYMKSKSGNTTYSTKNNIDPLFSFNTCLLWGGIASNMKALDMNQILVLNSNTEEEDIYYQKRSPDINEIKIKIVSLFGSTYLSRLGYSHDYKFPVDPTTKYTGLMLSQFRNNLFDTKTNNTLVFDGTNTNSTTNFIDVFILKQTPSDSGSSWNLYTNPYFTPINNNSNKVNNWASINFSAESEPLSVMTSENLSVLQGTSSSNLKLINVESNNTFINEMFSPVSSHRSQIIMQELRQNTRSKFINKHNNCSLYFTGNPEIPIYTLNGNFVTKIISNKYQFTDDSTQKSVGADGLTLEPNVYYTINQDDSTNRKNQIIFKYNDTIIKNNGPDDPWLAPNKSKIYIFYYLQGNSVNYDGWTDPEKWNDLEIDNLPAKTKDVFDKFHIMIGSINQDSFSGDPIPSVTLTMASIDPKSKVNNVPILFKGY